DVTPRDEAATPFLLDRLPGGSGVFIFLEIGNRHVGAFARHQHRHRAADAGIPAGDQHDLVLEFAAAPIERRGVARRGIELMLLPRLFQMLRSLLGRLRPRPGLHRLLLARGFGGLLLVLGFDAPLDVTLFAGGAGGLASGGRLVLGRILFHHVLQTSVARKTFSIATTPPLEHAARVRARFSPKTIRLGAVAWEAAASFLAPGLRGTGCIPAA